MSIGENVMVTYPTESTFGSPPLQFRFPIDLKMTPEMYFDFCQANPELKLEQLASGEIVVMSPTGGESGDRSSEINYQLRAWAKRDGRGKVFDSNTEFRLPLGSARCPDGCWVELSRWNALSPADRKVFPPLCPDFVIELRSETDRLIDLQNKLDEYLANGARLGWIIDPFTKSVHVYRPGQPSEVLANPDTVSGESVLPGFELDLKEIFAD